MEKIKIGTPKSFGIETQAYAEKVAKLLYDVFLKNATIIPRTADSLYELYDHSSIAVDNKMNIVGHVAFFPAHMAPQNVIVSEKSFLVGECGSFVISPDLQGQGYGKKLLEYAQNIQGSKYDIIVLGTLSPSMKHLCKMIGYEGIDFPGNLYEEGLKYFSSVPSIGEEKFKQDAFCGMYVNPNHEKYREKIKELLLV